MACPRRVGVPQGRAGGSWHVLVARETGTASGWKQSKEDRPAFTVAGQHARVRNQALCEAPGATTPSRFYYDISFGTPPLQDWQAIFGSGGSPFTCKIGGPPLQDWQAIPSKGACQSCNANFYW